MIIYIRDEINENEYRTPIVPYDTLRLVNSGFTIYIKKSNKRIYPNSEYNKYIHLTEMEWNHQFFSNALIIGLKDFDNLYSLYNHKHIYFSHSFKNQSNSINVLTEFKKSNSHIYDLEYFLDSNNKRLVSFGIFAGYIGGFLGIYQYLKKTIEKTNIKNLKPFKNKNEMLKLLDIYNNKKFEKIKIGIIGHKGNCGKGVIQLLNDLKIQYYIIDKNKNIDYSLFNIFYNCILLNNQNICFFDKNTIFSKYITIVDISCDVYSPNNPIYINNKITTWKQPVFEYNNNVDIIAIDNLPSLLPTESSDYFSNKLTDLLMDFINGDKNNYWKNALNIYNDKIKFLE